MMLDLASLPHLFLTFLFGTHFILILKPVRTLAKMCADNE